MQQQRKWFTAIVFGIGFSAGSLATVGVAVVSVLASDEPATFTNLATFPPTTPRDCAIRAVYHFADDDWGQRALIASAVLSGLRPDVELECGAPLLPSDVGALPDPYRLQAAIDAVDAVAAGTYELPVACDGVTAFSSPEAAPRSQCVYGDLAFTTAEAR